MTIETIDKYFGIPLSEWIERTPNELEMDAVGLWRIVPVGRDSFDLNGVELKEFVKRSIVALLKRGAVPVRPSAEKSRFWERQLQYVGSPEEIASDIVTEWENSGVDPNEEGLWFALPD